MVTVGEAAGTACRSQTDWLTPGDGEQGRPDLVRTPSLHDQIEIVGDVDTTDEAKDLRARPR